MAECTNCGEEFADKRKALGYEICLVCGHDVAYKLALEKANRVGPLFNKGGLQYISDEEDLTTIGKKV